MTSYSNAFYDYMKDFRQRSSKRVFEGLKFPIDKINFEYVNHQLINYLYYKKEMARWRKNIKKATLLKKAWGKQNAT